MRNLHQYGVEELTPSETKTIEGGALNFTLMHIYIPQYPEIEIWRPKIDFSQLPLWA